MNKGRLGECKSKDSRAHSHTSQGRSQMKTHQKGKYIL